MTMSTREVAELTGKQHKDVLYDTRCMFLQLGVNSADFSAQFKDSTNRTLPMYRLPKDLTLTLVSGYSVTLRHRIVTRWMESGGEHAWRCAALLARPRWGLRGLYLQKLQSLNPGLQNCPPLVLGIKPGLRVFEVHDSTVKVSHLHSAFTQKGELAECDPRLFTRCNVPLRHRDKRCRHSQHDDTDHDGPIELRPPPRITRECCAYKCREDDQDDEDKPYGPQGRLKLK